MSQKENIRVEEVERDKLSSKVRLICSHKPLENPSFDALVQRGQKLCDQVTYLEENLRLIEADFQNNQVILRSSDPDCVDSDIRYYEARLKKSGETTLQRYRYSKETGDREPADFVISHENLERLKRDLAT